MTTITRSPLVVSFAGASAVADDLGVEVAAAYGDVAAERQALAAGAGLVDRCARGAVRINGPDSLKFVHSLVSQDVAGLKFDDKGGVGDGAHALLLHPQGK